jgi:hypothetical protein
MRRYILVAAMLVATPAIADQKSAYTKLDIRNPQVCMDLTPAPVEGEPNDGVHFECKGFADYVVTFVEGDLRSYISYGKEESDHCARAQTFGGFNSAGETIEWRLNNGKPVATILRWTVSYDSEDSSKTREWLVVTKLEEGDSCHMGYVEGAYPKANETAQKLADDFAANFSCATSKPIFIARMGTATDSIAANEGCRE